MRRRPKLRSQYVREELKLAWDAGYADARYGGKHDTAKWGKIRRAAHRAGYAHGRAEGGA